MATYTDVEKWAKSLMIDPELWFTSSNDHCAITRVERNCYNTIPTFTLEIRPGSSDSANKLLEFANLRNELDFAISNNGIVVKGTKCCESFKLMPVKIIHSGPATIVFWNDKTKTIVRCSENDVYDEYAAFCSALAIKMYGSNSHLKKMIRNKTEDKTPNKEASVEVKCEDTSLQEALNKLKKAFRNDI